MYRGVDPNTFTARRFRPGVRKVVKSISVILATVIILPVMLITAFVVIKMWADAANKIEPEKSISQPVPTVEAIYNEALTIGSEGYVDYEDSRYVCSPMDTAIHITYDGPTFVCDKSGITPTITPLYDTEPIEELPSEISPELEREIEAMKEPEYRVEPVPSYATCEDVRAAGKAPIYPGQPGYKDSFDRDNDGIGCE
jgi:hypothetical protein